MVAVVVTGLMMVVMTDGGDGGEGWMSSDGDGFLVPPLMIQAMPLAWNLQLKCTRFAVHAHGFLRAELQHTC
eukprot:8729159-Lingulodinium_polyedra.AAC.1